MVTGPDNAAKGALAPPEVIVSHAKRVKCDGGGGALGHPVVFIELGAAGEAECVYCDRRFVYEPSADGADHH